MIGGRCRLAVTGSAPLSQQHGEFMAICFNMHVFEGSGMSETSAHCAVQSIHTMNFGAIGEALDKNTQMRIRSIPEMGYLVTDEQILDYGGHQEKVVCPRGELLLKGPSIFSGYYKDEQKTKESFTEDGWFMTGDIAMFDPVLNVAKLIDRKRGIVKLSQGEFISINSIEDAISKSRFVEQVFLYANRYQSFVLAVISPNRPYFKAQGFNQDDLSTCEAALIALEEDVKK